MAYKTVTAKDFEENFDEYMELIEKKKVPFEIVLDNGKSVYMEPYYEKNEIR